jgi:hypothetical protein
MGATIKRAQPPTQVSQHKGLGIGHEHPYCSWGVHLLESTEWAQLCEERQPVFFDFALAISH